MPDTTPPKGRPTPGRRDRSVAQQRRASRRRIIRYAWAVAALVVLAILLVWGTGSGGDAGTDAPLFGSASPPALTWSGTAG